VTCADRKTESAVLSNNRFASILRAVPGYVPGLLMLRHYRIGWLRFDLVAGLSVAAILVPQGMAYGSLAGVQPVYGLYAAIAAMTVYFFFATSRTMMIGPEANTAVIAAGVVAPLAAGDPARYAVLMAILALVTGLVLVLAGIIKLGFIADFLSRPVLVGYLTGMGLVVIAGQLGNLFGITIESDMFFQQLWELFTRLGQANLLSLGLGSAFIAILVMMKRRWPFFPAALAVSVLAIALVVAFSLDEKGLAVLGYVPPGLPSFEFPSIDIRTVGLLVPGALSLAVLIISDGLLTAQAFASKHRYQFSANREIVAFGLNNIAAGLFHGFPVGTSESRTATNDAAGGRTQVSALVAVIFACVTLIYLTSFLGSLPKVALSAIVILAGIGLLDFRALGEIYSVRKPYAWLAVLTTLGVLLLGPLPGILIAVVFSLLYLVTQMSRPHDAVLGTVEGLDGYHDISGNEDSETVPGLIVYRFEAPLMFVNANYFRRRVDELISFESVPVRCLVIAAESVPSVDITAADMLNSLQASLEKRGIVLAVATANATVRAMLTQTGVMQMIGEERFFPSVRTAVDAFTGGQLQK